MIEQPLFTPSLFKSKENISEALRRRKHNRHTKANPRNAFTLTKEQYESYYKFTFVRNPWSRAYSWYKNVMRDNSQRTSHKVEGNPSLNEFLRNHLGKGMLKPQTFWLKNFSGKIPMDFVGRFENLTEDFEKVCNALNLPQINLPHKVKGVSDDFRVHFDKDSIELTRATYREEIEMFQYSFEPL